jgi:indole-3-glycerol phosphate synthase
LTNGASSVILNASILGKNLAELLTWGTIMGVDCVVEVHSAYDLELALSLGSTVIMVNNWDRMTGTLYPKQVSTFY